MSRGVERLRWRWALPLAMAAAIVTAIPFLLSLPSHFDLHLQDGYVAFPPTSILFAGGAAFLLVLALGYLLVPHLTRRRTNRVLSVLHIALTLPAMTGLAVLLVGLMRAPRSAYDPSDYQRGYEVIASVARMGDFANAVLFLQVIFLVNLMLGIAGRKA